MKVAQKYSNVNIESYAWTEKLQLKVVCWNKHGTITHEHENEHGQVREWENKMNTDMDKNTNMDMDRVKKKQCLKNM